MENLSSSAVWLTCLTSSNSGPTLAFLILSRHSQELEGLALKETDLPEVGAKERILTLTLPSSSAESLK